MVAFWAVLASAGEASAVPDDRDHRVSVTLSPVHLALPMAEVTVEGRAGEDFGLGGLVGYGGRAGIPIFEVGALGRYYATGDFDGGFHLGTELMYFRGSAEGTQASAVSGGLLLGGKHAFGFGLTLDGAVGVGLAQVGASSDEAEVRVLAAVPLLNLQLGWSF